jgi:O-antigen/teichoic acid export membrane protein
VENKNIKDILTTSEVRVRAVKSVKWTVLSEIVSRSVQPLVTLILARILVPEDFGVVGVATIAIGLAQIFQDFGLGKTLIQRKTEISDSANVIFWTNLTLSLSLYLVVFVTAPLISKFFHEPNVTDVLRVLCLQIVIFSFISVHQALFQRNFQFKQLFFIKLFSAVTPSFASIPLALYGYGVWSLVYGSLAGAVVQVFLFWRASPWRPQLRYDFQLARQLFGFSAWVALEAFLSWLILWGDSIVLGHFLGVKELGVYRVGVTFLMLVFGVFFNPLMPIAYSSFSRFQSNHDELKQAFLGTVRIIASVSLPIGVGLAILAPSISSVIFGQKWQGIEIIIALIGIMHCIGWLVGINPEVYRAIGRPDINTKLLIAAVVYYIPVYVLAAPYGLFVFCLARVAVAIVAMGLHIFVANRILNLPLTYLGSCVKLPLVGILIMAIAVYFAVNFSGTFIGLEGWVRMISIIAFGGITYIVAMWFIEKKFVLKVISLAREGVA